MLIKKLTPTALMLSLLLVNCSKSEPESRLHETSAETFKSPLTLADAELIKADLEIINREHALAVSIEFGDETIQDMYADGLKSIKLDLSNLNDLVSLLQTEKNGQNFELLREVMELKCQSIVDQLELIAELSEFSSSASDTNTLTQISQTMNGAAGRIASLVKSYRAQ
jgi:hypothetical protein